MRGEHATGGEMFSYVSTEERIPKDHPIRGIDRLAREVERRMSRDFSRAYSHTGRPSIPPERLFRAVLLQIMFSIRSERQLMEQLRYNLLFRWFVSLTMDEPEWSVSVFTKNRDRLFQGELPRQFLDTVVREARERALLSEEHFTVDGTLIEAWASLKSFKKKGSAGDDSSSGSNPTVNFHGETRSNATHESTTDPEARLYRKGYGKEARLYYMGHVVMDNRHGLAVLGKVTSATGHAEPDAAVELLREIDAPRGFTVGADKGYDQRAFVNPVRELGGVPHVACKTRYSAIDGRVTRHEGYEISQRKRKRAEEIFGWTKTIGFLRKVKYRGRAVIDGLYQLHLAALDLLRINRLAPA